MILQDGCKRLTNVLQTIEMYVTIVNALAYDLVNVKVAF